MACNQCREALDTFEDDDSACLDAMLEQLNLTRHEFDVSERSRFELSPRSWLHERLALLGYVPASAVERLIAERGKAA